jgi:predicted DNA-binding transcriptional regulator AlpA
MKAFTTRAVARKLGIPAPTLFHYIRVGKVPRPKAIDSGDITIHLWTESEIEHVRQLLPKIANGRKTRYSKLREKEKAQPKKVVPRKKRTPKKNQTAESQ